MSRTATNQTVRDQKRDVAAMRKADEYRSPVGPFGAFQLWSDHQMQVLRRREKAVIGLDPVARIEILFGL